MTPPPPISDIGSGAEDDSGLPLSTNLRMLSTTTVVQQEDDSVLLLGGCSQQVYIAAVDVDFNAAPLLGHDGEESLTGAAVDRDDGWDQEHLGVHLQNVLGRNIYASNLSLFTQVANFAEGNAQMALELRRGLESMLSKFIEKNKGETANTSEHEFASLPHVDSSRRNKRLRPALSPEKRL